MEGRQVSHRESAVAVTSLRAVADRWRDLSLPSWLWRLLIAVAVGLVLGWLGPFRTNPTFSLPIRYGFWLTMAVIGFVFIMAAEPLIPARLRKDTRVELLAVGAASAIPMTFVVAWVFSMLQPGRSFPPERLLALYFPVAAVQLLIAFAAAPKWSVPIAAPARRDNALLGRLPPELGTELIALEAEDHYLRVHTRLGSALILMRLSDAIAAAGPDAGVQVHRSWWVGRDAVERRQRGNRSALTLVNGLTVPIGRTFAPAVRAAFG